MQVDVIIAQHGQPQLTITCIETLRRHHGDEPAVRLVDDGSAAGDVEQVQAAGLCNVELVRRPHRGVTAAWNAAAARSQADVLVFLNNDVITVGPWVERLIAPLHRPRIRVAGVALRRERQLEEALLARLPTREFAVGWCFAVRRQDFEAVGWFREALRLYFSDTDLQARLLQGRDAGSGSLAIVPQLPLRHLGHATAALDPARKARWQADRRRFRRLWNGMATTR